MLFLCTAWGCDPRRERMKHILILSDTHGLLREEVKALLAQADVVIHAGDINTPAIVDTLRAVGESYIVRGNNDKDWAEGLPLSLTFTVEGVRFFLVHNKKDVPKDLTGVDVVVFGPNTRSGRTTASCG